MTQLLTQFKTTEFRNTYDNNSAPVRACNNDSVKSNDKRSTYWMLDQKDGGKTMGIGDIWKDNPNASSTNNIFLNNFMMKVGFGLNKLLDKDITFLITTPGFVQTTIPTHQELHLDTQHVNFKKPGYSYILHVPLEREGMHLRLGKINKKSELIHGLIHIPFGSVILLHYTQLHAGHYGNPTNFCFHAVLSDRAWDGSHLMPLGKYLKKKMTLQDDAITRIVTDFKKYINDI